MTHLQCYKKVPIEDLPARVREQAVPLNRIPVERVREKAEPYTLPLVQKREKRPNTSSD